MIKSNSQKLRIVCKNTDADVTAVRANRAFCTMAAELLDCLCGRSNARTLSEAICTFEDLSRFHTEVYGPLLIDRPDLQKGKLVNPLLVAAMRLMAARLRMLEPRGTGKPNLAVYNASKELSRAVERIARVVEKKKKEANEACNSRHKATNR